MRVPATALVVLGSLAGCGSGGEAFFPLEVGNRWTYSVRAGFLSRVEDVRVERALSVADARGFELTGPMGVSRFVWKEGTLLAEDLPGTRFSPAVPLLVGGSVKASRNWRGIVRTMAGEREARGTLVQASDSLTIAGRGYDTRRTTLTVEGLGPRLELQSWFAEGIGLLRQEQRIGDQLVRSVEYLAGP
ncbi:MAG TPA: hypothetical protein PLL78_11705 [Fimbriimonadaceae bacterium]|nr:hypothetical protein [Fimbriimonadaceae bacterium]